MKKLDSKDNKDLKQFFQDDQRERRITEYSRKRLPVVENDLKRRTLVCAMLDDGRVVTPRDHYHAAMIFQHGTSIEDYKLAHALACRSCEMQDDDDAKWLCAAATDRLLVAQGKRQKFGTQFCSVEISSGSKSAPRRAMMRLCPYDTRTSDATRKRYGIPPLKELIAMEAELTKKLAENF